MSGEYKMDAFIGFRVTSYLKERMQTQADKERRSLSNLIIKLMEEYLETLKDE